MSLTDEQIAAMMQKHITCKTILSEPEDEEKVINEHIQEGWEVANKVECGQRVKITFRKVEKIKTNS